MSNTIHVVYRGYYGDDYIIENITNDLTYADKIIFYHQPKPWFEVTVAKHKDVEYIIPCPIDALYPRLCSISHPNFHLLQDHTYQPSSQHIITRTLEEHGVPEYLVFKNTDHIEYEQGVPVLIEAMRREGHAQGTTIPVSLWRTPNYWLPTRSTRHATMVYRGDVLASGAQVKLNGQIGDSEVFRDERCKSVDVGFACHPSTMWWKYLLRIAQAPLIPDAAPVHGWYHEVWLPWKEGMEVKGWCEGELEFGEVVKGVVLPRCMEGGVGG